MANTRKRLINYNSRCSMVIDLNHRLRIHFILHMKNLSWDKLLNWKVGFQVNKLNVASNCN